MSTPKQSSEAKPADLAPDAEAEFVYGTERFAAETGCEVIWAGKYGCCFAASISFPNRALAAQEDSQEK